MPDRATVRSVAGQDFNVSVYPETGTTKADVIDYLHVAEVMLPHLAGRPMTRKR